MDAQWREDQERRGRALADVLAVPGDATEELESVEDVSFVMKGGDVVNEAAGA